MPMEYGQICDFKTLNIGHTKVSIHQIKKLSLRDTVITNIKNRN